MELSEKTKQRIARLVEKDFVIEVLNKRLKKYYPDFKEIKNLELDPFKRHLGVTSAVFVIEYKIKYINISGQEKNIDIFSSAHSDGSRRASYEKTNVLYKNGFSQGKYRVTRPLFFLEEQIAFFYESSPGRSLFNFFTEDPSSDLREAFKLTTGWVKKLHNVDIKKVKYNWSTFWVSQMTPNPERFIVDFRETDEKLGYIVDILVQDMNKLEHNFRKEIGNILVYGDFHPENVIIKDLKAKDIEMIDFTDIALGDPMMDLGTFIQQFDFMGHNFVSREEINKYKQYFIEAYFEKKFTEIDIKFINRINLYQAWTALRSAVFLFYMKDVENPVDDLLQDGVNYLELAKNNECQINLH